MTEKILNIMLVAMAILFCVVFAIKTVLIDVVKEEKDAEWEANKDNITTSSNASYEISIDPLYN